MAARPGPRRALLATALLAAALSAFASGSSCDPTPGPVPGLTETFAPALVPVPGGLVNAAGINLIVRRVDLSLDTRLGPHAVGATYNSGRGEWLWTFDVRYDGTTFVDYSGALLHVAGLLPGDAIPGTHWVVLDGERLKTKGGLVHEFDAGGRLRALHWASSAYPRLELRSEPIAGAPRTTRVEQCVEAGSCSEVFAIRYDAAGRVASLHDRAGRRAEFAWDAEGRLVAARDALDLARSWPGFRYEYAGRRLAALTNSEGERVEYRFGRRALSVRQVGAGDPTWQIAARQAGDGLFRTSCLDPLGRARTITWDAQRRVHELRDAAGESIAFEWQGLRIARRRDPDGTATRWRYEGGDDPVEVLRPSGRALRIRYAPGGVDRAAPRARPLLRVEDDLGVLRARAYDAAGRLVALTNGAGETTRLAYGPDEMLASVTAPSGVRLRLAEYGEHGRPGLVEVGGRTRQLAYDAVGNLLAGDEPRGEGAPGLGGVVARSFDEDRNLAALVLADLPALAGGAPRTALLRIAHRSDGRRLQVSRPHGGDTRFVYDVLGRLAAREERADGVFERTTFEWDALGRLVGFERPNGMREETAYDAAGRVAGRRWLRDGLVEARLALAWEAGRLVALEDSRHAAPERYEYDAAGRPSGVAFPGGERLELAWDLRDRPVEARLRFPDGASRSLEFEWDGADRERAVWDGGALVLERAWQAGRLAATRYGNGLERRYAYDPALGTLVGAVTRDAAGAEVARTDVVPSVCAEAPVLFCAAEASQAGGVGSHEAFWLGPDPEATGSGGDAAGRRVAIARLAWSAPDIQAFDRHYVYDELSNLLAALTAGEPRTFHYNEERNRLLRIEGAGGEPLHSYAWDRAGFAVERDGVPLAWDAAGRIAAVGAHTELLWDGLGRPLARRASGVESRRLFGGLVEADAAGTALALDLGEVRADLRSGERWYRHADLRGNVRAVTDGRGEVVARYVYGAYGVELAAGTRVQGPSFARGMPLGDLVLLGHRPYDPAAARFLAPDPVYQLLNGYAYALGNPVWRWDPGGREGTLLGLRAVQWAAWSGLAASVAAATGQPQLGSMLGVAAGTFVVIDAHGGFPWEGDRSLRDLADLFGDPAAPDAGPPAAPQGGAIGGGFGFEASALSSLSEYGTIARLVGNAVPAGGGGGGGELGLCSAASSRAAPRLGRLLLPLLLLNALLGLALLWSGR